VLSATTHDEKPYVAGAKDAGQPQWEDIAFGAMCPCKCCASCGAEQPILEMQVIGEGVYGQPPMS
jgi:hypothetical protein